jgi:hypothetical protein
MQRESGWYWVKVEKEDKYIIGYYHSDVKWWELCGYGQIFYDSEFYKILKTRIKSPEEK